MSARRIERALARLASPQAMLAPSGAGFGVYASTDRRRRPLIRLTTPEVRALETDGVLAATPERDVFILSDAGHARTRREAAAVSEAFTAQHAPIEDRSVIDDDGAMRRVRGVDGAAPLRRLTALRDADGKPWLSPQELAAAQRLREDWQRAQAGLVRGSDWSAAPQSGSARGGGGAQEAALAARCDAQRRMQNALDALAVPLRRVVERVCLSEEGLEALERSEGWPARSGKLALKLGLAQLAASAR